MDYLNMCYPGGKRKALTLSFDDACVQDREMISILNKRGLKCTFNINTGCFAPEGTVFRPDEYYRKLTEKDAVEVYKNSGQEIALHGLSHQFMDRIPLCAATNEILEDRRNAERLFGTIIRGFAYPFGGCNDDLVNAARSCGMAYCRTAEFTEKFDLPKDWMRLPATCLYRSPKLMSLSHKFVEEAPYGWPWYFLIVGHSFEFERDNSWNSFDEFIDLIGNRSDIWYVTSMEICNYIQCYNQLQTSLDATILHNPTDTELFFIYKDTVYSIKPCETLRLA